MHAEAANTVTPRRHGPHRSLAPVAESGNIYDVALRPDWAGFELANFGLQPRWRLFDGIEQMRGRAGKFKKFRMSAAPAVALLLVGRPPSRRGRSLRRLGGADDDGPGDVTRIELSKAPQTLNLHIRENARAASGGCVTVIRKPTPSLGHRVTTMASIDPNKSTRTTTATVERWVAGRTQTLRVARRMS
jgi:hypothetical protein